MSLWWLSSISHVYPNFGLVLLQSKLIIYSPEHYRVLDHPALCSMQSPVFEVPGVAPQNIQTYVVEYWQIEHIFKRPVVWLGLTQIRHLPEQSVSGPPDWNIPDPPDFCFFTNLEIETEIVILIGPLKIANGEPLLKYQACINWAFSIYAQISCVSQPDSWARNVVLKGP